MSESKDGATGELDDEHLANVSGGVGVVGAADLMEEEGIASPRDPASKVQHKEFSITKLIDKPSV